MTRLRKNCWERVKKPQCGSIAGLGMRGLRTSGPGSSGLNIRVNPWPNDGL